MNVPLRRRAAGALALVATLVIAGCDGGSSPTAPQTASALFTYQSLLSEQPTTDPDVGACLHHNNGNYLVFERGSTGSYFLNGMGGSRFARQVESVPVGVELVVTVSDRLTCYLEDARHNKVTDEVFANGVRLTRVVSVDPGNGLSVPGLAFTIDRGGRILQ